MHNMSPLPFFCCTWYMFSDTSLGGHEDFGGHNDGGKKQVYQVLLLPRRCGLSFYCAKKHKIGGEIFTMTRPLRT